MNSPTSTAVPPSETHEVLPPVSKRRRFTAAEKLRIVKAAAACQARGEVGALLRREGIYSSHLALWRKAFDAHGLESLAARTPGRKKRVDAKDAQIAALTRRAPRLEEELELARKLIELQKNSRRSWA
jgi:transposase-like protein